MTSIAEPVEGQRRIGGKIRARVGITGSNVILGSLE